MRETGDLARKVMDQFAACVLDRKRKLVLQALAALYISRLRDPLKRAAALGEAQDYKPLPRRKQVS